MGTYLDVHECKNCLDKCATCSNNITCDSCKYPLVFYQNDCLIKCPDTFTQINYKCYPQKPCLGYIYQQNCYTQCPINTFISTVNTCDDCPSSCPQCLNTTFCLSCKAGFYLSINPLTNTQVCISDCPSSTYINNIYCVPCPSPCEKCLIN
jgi:proprotein convertase subtilisin/kexin type 5